MKKYYLVSYHDEDKPDEFIFIDSSEDSYRLMLEMGWSSQSCGFETREELVRHYKVPDWDCSVCGGIVSLNYTNREDLSRNKCCFTCDHWRRCLSGLNAEGGKFIIDGSFYKCDRKNPILKDDSSFLGFAGRVFEILPNECEKSFKTNNLWHGGKIPARYGVEDTAKFLKNKQNEHIY